MAPLPAAEPAEPVERLPMPSRNPLPLSAGQETQVRDLYFARVRALCAAEIKGSFFAPATVTSPELLGQLSSSAGGGRVHLANSGFSQNSQNALSAGHSQRPSRKDREAKDRRRKEQEKFHREWWGLPEADREGEKGKAVLRNAERVGGFPKSDDGQLSKDRHR
ncbi:hypothetical protein VE04_02876 [Pseudogymnoascus sp. 24MN13]|nr:hypothetical protein VE04_02876 [Pseudogymnoascus sp. 24MN13]